MPARNAVAAVVASLAVLVEAAGTVAAEPGTYQHDLAEVAAQAINWIGNQVPTTPRAAVVFDIGETALSNWEVVSANDFGRFANGPCDLAADPTVVQPTLDTYNTAKSLGAAVFFITGCDEAQRAVTEQSLQSAGYTGYTRLVMTPPGAQYASVADFKAPQRAAIEAEGYTIVANIGDQRSDLAGGHSQQDFLLPDPFYRIP